MSFDSGIRAAVSSDAGVIARFYEEVRRDTVPIAHTVDEVEGWIRAVLIARGSSFVYILDGQVVAWLDVFDSWVDQLYCHKEFTGRGIGLSLLNHAKGLSPNELMLYTFQVNEGARRFYAREDFIEVEQTDGASNEERAPDVRLLWRPKPD